MGARSSCTDIRGNCESPISGMSMSPISISSRSISEHVREGARNCRGLLTGVFGGWRNGEETGQIMSFEDQSKSELARFSSASDRSFESEEKSSRPGVFEAGREEIFGDVAWETVALSL